MGSVEFDAGSSWIGFVIVLSGLYWTIQAMKYHKSAKTLSAGYQPFNDQQQSDQEQLPRRSNAPLIVEVDSNGPNSHHPMSLEPNMSSTLSPKSIYSQSLIRNAVPPSPFIGTQDYGTPQGNDNTLGHPKRRTKTLSMTRSLSPMPRTRFILKRSKRRT